MNKKVIAIMVSDIHLSLEPPIARSGEPDWLEAQKRQLDQLYFLAEEKYGVPILCAGDLFHSWKVSPELINFALINLPNNMYCIPGQHDLPNHSLDQMNRSGFGVMVKTGKINYLAPNEWWRVETPNQYINVKGFPWGYTPTSSKTALHTHGNDLKVAMVHAYCWDNTHGYPGADKSTYVGKYDLKGFDVALFGDNHQQFLTKNKKTTVFNHGCFIQRASNERHFTPRVGLLHEDGSVSLHTLNTSKDVWLPEEKALRLEETTTNIKGLLRMMDSLGDSSEDFRVAMKTYFRQFGVPKSVRVIIEAALDQHQ